MPTRDRARGKALAVLPQVHLEEADVHDERQLARVVAGHDAVVNLVAILHGTPQEFRRVHVDLVKKLVGACMKSGPKRVVHISALGVESSKPSEYLKSKAEGERLLRESPLDVTVLRPSVIYGAQDRFLNTFERLQRFAPFVPLACSDARFQPVWVADVASATAACLARAETTGRIYECTGPDVMTLRELVQFAGRRGGVRRPVVPLPWRLAWLQAWLMEHLPGEPLLSRDNLLSMQTPNVASGAHPSLQDLGIRPRGLIEPLRHAG